MTMPEEINRRFASISAAIHFAPTEQAVLNLYYEGIDPKRIHLTGNTIVDATLEHASLAVKKSKIFEKIKFSKKRDLLVITTHRPANVDVKENLQQICNALIELKEFTIVFPVHTRTMKRLEEFNLKSNLIKTSHINLLEPLGYLDFLNLMQKASFILTDSGGLQEEAITLKKPCITLRTNTERPETVKLGVNYLVGTDYTKIITTIRSLAQSKNIQEKFEQMKNPYGDGKASDKIINLIIEKLTQDNLKFTPPNIQKGSLEYQLIKTSREITVKKFEKENNVVITLVYDEKGLPQIIPQRIPKGWFMRIQK